MKKQIKISNKTKKILIFKSIPLKVYVVFYWKFECTNHEYK
jgi:hypothetical protein